MMRAVILTPWRTDHAERAALYGLVRAQQETLGLPIYTGDSAEEPFNIQRAWNAAADAAGQWDVALFWGADFLLEDTASALEAVDHAAAGNPYVFAFDKVTKLTLPETRLVLKGRPAPVRNDVLPFGGVRAVPAEWWAKCGHYDVRFRGWGHGDRAYVRVMERMGGVATRVEGRMIMLRHTGRAHLPNDPYYSFQAENLALLRSEYGGGDEGVS